MILIMIEIVEVQPRQDGEWITVIAMEDCNKMTFWSLTSSIHYFDAWKNYWNM